MVGAERETGSPFIQEMDTHFLSLGVCDLIQDITGRVGGLNGRFMIDQHGGML